MIPNPLCPTAQKSHTPAYCTDQHSPNSRIPHGSICLPHHSRFIRYHSAIFPHLSMPHRPTGSTTQHSPHPNISRTQIRHTVAYPMAQHSLDPQDTPPQNAFPLSLGLTSWEGEQCTSRTTVAHHSSAAQTSLVASVSSPTSGQT